MSGIAANGAAYQALFGDRYIETLRPGPWHMSNEERFEIIHAYARDAI